jgi:hypothetical protein
VIQNAEEALKAGSEEQRRPSSLVRWLKNGEWNSRSWYGMEAHFSMEKTRNPSGQGERIGACSNTRK